MRRLLAVVALMMVMFASFAPVSVATDGKDARLWIVTPERIRVTPQAEAWRLSIFALALESRTEPLIVESISVLGHDLASAVDGERSPKVPLTVVPGVTGQTLDRWSELRRNREQGLISAEENAELKRLTDLIEQKTGNSVVPLELRIDTTRLPFKVEDFKDYPVTVKVRSGNVVNEFSTILAIRTLPADTSWSPADLHLHSTYSDGTKTVSEIATTLKDSGYKIAYLTDHTDLIPNNAGGWSQYAAGVANASTADISLYPGAEMTVGEWGYYYPPSGPPEWRFFVKGDLLAYGINSLVGLDNKTHSPQTGIDNVIGNNPAGPSSAAIAHPYSFFVPWTDWSVLRYRGLELMAAGQENFGDTTNPMTTWRAELSRLLPNTFAAGYFASARTGSDWHASVSDRTHPGYVTWVGTSSWRSKSSVDNALHAGKTIASQKGGLAYMSLTRGSTVGQVGDRIIGIPANATFQLQIAFKPVESGTYTIKVYRNNKQEEVFTYTASFNAGATYNPAGSSYYFRFPGGSNYYYLSISGPDFIYTSPIFVKD